MELAVGRIAKSHGVRGEVAVDLRTDSPEERFAPGSRLLCRVGRGRRAKDSHLTVESSRFHSGRMLVRFEGVAGREAADALRGAVLLVDSADIDVPDDPDEFADHQLLGLTAVSETGDVLGEVSDILHIPAGDVLQLRMDGGAEGLVPFIRDFVPEIDLESGRVVITPPEGLLPHGDEPPETA